MKLQRLSVKDLQQHVLDLCEYKGLAVYRCKRLSQSDAVREHDMIKIAPIRSRSSYAVAMHEIGHHFGQHQGSPQVMVRERWAWRWARANALVWTPAMEREVQKSLAWYALRAARIDRAGGHR